MSVAKPPEPRRRMLRGRRRSAADADRGVVQIDAPHRGRHARGASRGGTTLLVAWELGYNRRLILRTEATGSVPEGLVRSLPGQMSKRHPWI
jgi:hypothetical protein